MNIELKIAFILASFAIIYVVIRSVKKHSLHPSFAVLWILIGLFLLSLSFLESFYAYVARNVFGLYGGDHLIYISLISFLLVYCFYLTTRICQMADRISKLISFTAVTESEVAALKKEKNQNGQ
ncbi:MAG: DUF2304 domain-containing protein [Bdellovibrio sp.]|nr:DUF2304 domain-containing protein [Bdellovibrio sp.]